MRISQVRANYNYIKKYGKDKVINKERTDMCKDKEKEDIKWCYVNQPSYRRCVKCFAAIYWDSTPNKKYITCDKCRKDSDE